MINVKYTIFYFSVREKHKRYTPDPITGVKQRKRKHKRKSLDVENPEGQSQPEVHRRITIKVQLRFYKSYNVTSFYTLLRTHMKNY